jgi:hypothetical protein
MNKEQALWDMRLHTQLCYPSDGKIVRCFMCGTNHIRKAGWAHKDHPVCDSCDDKMLEYVESVIIKYSKEG